MNVCSLFAGAGGFELGAIWAGLTPIVSVEIDPEAQVTLKKNFPNLILHDDIHTFNADEWRGRIDIVCGGFPCQPFSYTGPQLGFADARYLWPEMYASIQRIQPSWVVAENVNGILTAEDGVVLENIRLDLEAEAYQTLIFNIPAQAVKAPHDRPRVWIIAHAPSKRLQGSRQLGQPVYTAESTYEEKHYAFNADQFQKTWEEVASALCRVDDGVSR